MVKYECWSCGEDLTDEVLRRIKNDPDDVSRVLEMKTLASFKSSEQLRWKVIVECSKAHKNVFEGDGG